MAFVSMPARSDIPCYDYEIQLEQVIYNIVICFNERTGFWYMDIADQNNVALLSGIKLVTGELLINQYADSSLPPGQFFIFDTSNTNSDPGRETLGTIHRLLYRESTT